MDKLEICQGDQEWKIYLSRGGLPTAMIYDREIPELIELLQSRLPVATSNLNFWQAYQAMERGERVGNDELNTRKHHYEIQENEIYFTYDHDEPRIVKFNALCLGSTAWRIVPKCPRYKVGDRFDISGCQVQFATIIAAEVVVGTAGTYVVALRKENGDLIRFQVVTDDWLDQYTKLPS